MASESGEMILVRCAREGQDARTPQLGFPFCAKNKFKNPTCASDTWGTRNQHQIHLRRLRFQKLQVERDGYFFADENAAAFEDAIPSQAEILAIDMR